MRPMQAKEHRRRIRLVRKLKALSEEQGLNVPDVAKMLGTANSTVHRWFGEYGVPTGSRMQRISELIEAMEGPKTTVKRPANGPSRVTKPAPVVDGSTKTPHDMVRLLVLEYLATCSSKDFEAVMSATLVARGMVSVGTVGE